MDAQFQLPFALDLGASFLMAVTGAWAAIRRRYDFIGVFVLALVTGLGGGLLRDAVFIQQVEWMSQPGDSRKRVGTVSF